MFVTLVPLKVGTQQNEPAGKSATSSRNLVQAQSSEQAPPVCLGS